MMSAEDVDKLTVLGLLLVELCVARQEDRFTGTATPQPLGPLGAPAIINGHFK